MSLFKYSKISPLINTNKRERVVNETIIIKLKYCNYRNIFYLPLKKLNYMRENPRQIFK